MSSITKNDPATFSNHYQTHEEESKTFSSSLKVKEASQGRPLLNIGPPREPGSSSRFLSANRVSLNESNKPLSRDDLETFMNVAQALPSRPEHDDFKREVLSLVTKGPNNFYAKHLNSAKAIVLSLSRNKKNDLIRHDCGKFLLFQNKLKDGVLVIKKLTKCPMNDGIRLKFAKLCLEKCNLDNRYLALASIAASHLSERNDPEHSMSQNNFMRFKLAKDCYQIFASNPKYLKYVCYLASGLPKTSIYDEIKRNIGEKYINLGLFNFAAITAKRLSRNGDRMNRFMNNMQKATIAVNCVRKNQLKESIDLVKMLPSKQRYDSTKKVVINRLFSLNLVEAAEEVAKTLSRDLS